MPEHKEYRPAWIWGAGPGGATTPDEETLGNPYELLVNLAEFDLQSARPGDWLNFHAGLIELLRLVQHKGGAVIFNTEDPLGMRAVEEELSPIADDLRRLVRQYVANKG